MIGIRILQVIFMAGTVFLALFTLAQAYLLARWLILWLRGRHTLPTPPAPADWPHVLVQLPIYNEGAVVRQLLAAAAALDYPHKQLTIQVLDDSTDNTADRAAALCAYYRRMGIDMQHVRRDSRAGFKAGALAYGLSLRPDVSFAAVFDADFIPPRDFLRRTIPHLLAEPRAAFVQTRWDHLNPRQNWLTRAQQLAFDAYYMIEQTARSRTGLLMTFNGTGGVWRTAAITDAGGWSAETLTEDFDLSYRAQIRGWRAVFLPEVSVPGEIPPAAEVYKRQQMRWATGSDQTFLKMIGPVWRSKLSLVQKLMATAHLMQYLPHPVMLLLLLLAPLMIATGAYHGLPLAPLAVLSLVGPVMTAISQALIGGAWLWRTAHYPLVMVLGTGMMWNNTRAMFRAIASWRARRELTFDRTPKFSTQRPPRLPASAHTVVELALAGYALLVMFMAWRSVPSVAPLFGLYAVSLGLMSTSALWYAWRWPRARHAPASLPPRATDRRPATESRRP